jgi:hypothetical protein
MKYLLVGLFLVGGCAHQTPEQRAAEQQRREKCARVEIYPMGVTPPRPYRALGPVASYDGADPALRERKLQQQACDIGADAVIDVKPEMGDRDGTTGMAVAYVEETPPPVAQ